MNIEQERAEFEAWGRTMSGWSGRRDKFCDYVCETEEFSWSAWKAGRATLQSQDREALTKLLDACPTTLHCDDFHHTKADQHMDGEYCPPLARYLAAIDHARHVEGKS